MLAQRAYQVDSTSERIQIGQNHLVLKTYAYPERHSYHLTAAFRPSTPSLKTVLMPCTKRSDNINIMYATRTGRGVATTSGISFGENAPAIRIRPP